MSREYRKRLFEILDQIDELAEPQGQAEKLSQPQAPVAVMPGREVEKQEGKARETTATVPAGLPEGWTGPNHDTKKRYDPEFKKMVVQMHRDEGRPVAEITNQYGVSKATATKWCSDMRYENHARLSAAEKELRDARMEAERVREENAFLKQVLVLVFGKEMEVQA